MGQESTRTFNQPTVKRHRDCWRAARAPGDCARRESIASGDFACESELRNSWPSVRARPEEKEDTVSPALIDTWAATLMRVADEGRHL